MGAETPLFADSTKTDSLTITLNGNLPATFMTECAIAIATIATVVVNHRRRRGRQEMAAAISKSLAACKNDGERKRRQSSSELVFHRFFPRLKVTPQANITDFQNEAAQKSTQNMPKNRWLFLTVIDESCSRNLVCEKSGYTNN
ncbi:MAG: hypothetical protein P4L53_08875 [Candidatus Obscuribacterales bacterium]|nr:hypothetical protein [Candidatus Obscuribacterales bacterium]